jgi:hypothetical protein
MSRGYATNVVYFKVTAGTALLADLERSKVARGAALALPKPADSGTLQRVEEGRSVEQAGSLLVSLRKGCLRAERVDCLRPGGSARLNLPKSDPKGTRRGGHSRHEMQTACRTAVTHAHRLLIRGGFSTTHDRNLSAGSIDVKRQAGAIRAKLTTPRPRSTERSKTVK